MVTASSRAGSEENERVRAASGVRVESRRRWAGGMGEQGVGRLLVVGAGEEGMHSVLLLIFWTQSTHTLQSRSAAASKAGDPSLEREHIMQLTE